MGCHVAHAHMHTRTANQMQHVEQSEYYSDTDVDEAFEDRVGAIGDGKQEGRGRLGIALSFSLVVMMILFLLGTPHTPHTPHTSND